MTGNQNSAAAWLISLGMALYGNFQFLGQFGQLNAPKVSI